MIRMSRSFHEFLKNIGGSELQTGSVDAGMASEIFFFQQIFINQKIDLLFDIVHQSENADAARSNVQKFFHVLGFREGKAGYTELM